MRQARNSKNPTVKKTQKRKPGVKEEKLGKKRTPSRLQKGGSCVRKTLIGGGKEVRKQTHHKNNRTSPRKRNNSKNVKSRGQFPLTKTKKKKKTVTTGKTRNLCERGGNRLGLQRNSPESAWGGGGGRGVQKGGEGGFRRPRKGYFDADRKKMKISQTGERNVGGYCKLGRREVPVASPEKMQWEKRKASGLGK